MISSWELSLFHGILVFTDVFYNRISMIITNIENFKKKFQEYQKSGNFFNEKNLIKKFSWKNDLLFFLENFQHYRISQLELIIDITQKIFGNESLKNVGQSPTLLQAL